MRPYTSRSPQNDAAQNASVASRYPPENNVSSASESPKSGLTATPPRTGLYLVLLRGSRLIEAITLEKDPVRM